MLCSGTDLEELKDFLMSELLWSERKIPLAILHRNIAKKLSDNDN